MFLFTLLCLFICRPQRTLWSLTQLWTIQQSAHPRTYSGKHWLYIYYSPDCRVNIPYKKRNVHFSFLFHLFSFSSSLLKLFFNHHYWEMFWNGHFIPHWFIIYLENGIEIWYHSGFTLTIFDSWFTELLSFPVRWQIWLDFNSISLTIYFLFPEFTEKII